LLDQLADLGADMMDSVLDGLEAKTIERMLSDLGLIKDNLRAATARNAQQQSNQPQTDKVLAS
jgi:hypothetical protein